MLRDVDDRLEARRNGEQKMREAQEWWANADKAIHKYRIWAMLLIGRQFALHLLESQYRKAQPVAQARNLIAARNEAHDFMLVSMESACNSAACARSCEAMARAYFEEYEQREAARDALIVGVEEDDRHHD